MANHYMKQLNNDAGIIQFKYPTREALEKSREREAGNDWKYYVRFDDARWIEVKIPASETCKMSGQQANITCEVSE
jgi:hypothetical protein